MVWARKLARWIRRIWLPLPYSGEPQETTIDLRRVSSRDEFQRELTKHFPIDADHRELWNSLYQAILTNQTGPRTLRFLGWAGFESRMPRYARRLKRLLVDHQKLWGTRIGGVQLLTVKWG